MSSIFTAYIQNILYRENVFLLKIKESKKKWKILRFLRSIKWNDKERRIFCLKSRFLAQTKMLPFPCLPVRTPFSIIQTTYKKLNFLMTYIILVPLGRKGGGDFDYPSPHNPFESGIKRLLIFKQKNAVFRVLGLKKKNLHAPFLIFFDTPHSKCKNIRTYCFMGVKWFLKIINKNNDNQKLFRVRMKIIFVKEKKQNCTGYPKMLLEGVK